MTYDNTTSSHNFAPVKDITHKPKRLQGDNVKKALKERVEKPENEDEIRPKTTLGNFTLESAITYYENNAVGELEKLYKVTAQWLRLLLVKPKKSIKEEPKATEPFDENEVDIK